MPRRANDSSDPSLRRGVSTSATASISISCISPSSSISTSTDYHATFTAVRASSCRRTCSSRSARQPVWFSTKLVFVMCENSSSRAPTSSGPQRRFRFLAGGAAALEAPLALLAAFDEAAAVSTRAFPEEDAPATPLDHTRGGASSPITCYALQTNSHKFDRH